MKGKTIVADEVVVERVPRAVATSALRKDRSLRPGPGLAEACVMGEQEALAIRDSWAPKFSVRTVTIEEHARMLARNPVTFHG